MRVKIGIAGVLGFGVSMTVALGQGPRGAVLLPPQAADPAEMPVARAAAEPLLPLQSTPVTRSAANTDGPAWINGTDPNLRPASGIATNSVARSSNSKDDPSLFSKGFDRIKSTFGNGENANRPNPQQQGGAAPHGREQPNAQTPFRSTSAGGQPVYAGPPAYRWYGWGSVTPGANPYAPNGHYQQASANWYSITGATPGAFPVTVAEPMRAAQGMEPPAYTGMPPVPHTQPVYTPTPQPVAVAAPIHRAPAPVSVATPEPRVTPRQPAAAREPVAPPTPSDPIAPVAVPTLTALPLPVVPPAPAGGTMEPVPSRLDVIASPVPMLPSATNPGMPLPPLPPLPALPPVTTPGEAGVPLVGTTVTEPPTALPMSVTEEQPKWQPRGGQPGQPSPTGGSDWNRAGTPKPQPDGNWQQRDTTRTPTVARGQIADTEPDPIVTLIRRTCESRASGLDVRWSGTKKLSVSFGCSTAEEAKKLVKDISDRAELAPYQIDFHVKVK